MGILKIKRLTEQAILPQAATTGSAGMDVCALLEEPLTLQPGERALIPTGIAAQAEPGQALFLFARSGLSVKYGLSLSNGVGVIDSDYRGEIRVGLVHLGDQPYTLQPGERIAQLVLMHYEIPEIEEVDVLEESQRGAGGFGSTGKEGGGR